MTPNDSIEGRTHYDAGVRLIDLSCTGALVETRRAIPRGASLRLEIDVNNDGYGSPLSLGAHVIRTSPGPDGAVRLGLQFDGLSEVDRDRLSDLVAMTPRVERRAEPRMYLGTTAQLKKEIEIQVLNLGLFGGLFRLDTPLEFESQHDFVFVLPQGEVRARGMVRHCEAWVDPKRRASFRLGVEFLELEPHNRERVVAYLEERIQAS